MMFSRTSCKAFAMGFCAILFNFYILGNSVNNQTIETLKQFMDIYAVQNLDTGLKDFLKHIETKNNNAKLNEKQAIKLIKHYLKSDQRNKATLTAIINAHFNKSSILAHYIAGDCCMQTLKLGKAKEYFNHILSQKPDHFDTKKKLAHIHVYENYTKKR